MAVPEAGQQQLAHLFGDVYAAAGWQPQRRVLAELLANVSAALAGGQGEDSGWDAAGTARLTAALLEAAGTGAAALGKKGGGKGGDPSGPVDIGWLGVMLAAAVIGVNGLFSIWLRLGLHGKLAVATVRCIAQLSVLGYILVPIFEINHWWLTLLYTLFMLAVAAVEAVSRPTQTYPGMLVQVLIALGLASGLVITYGLALVVQVSPWYDPQYLIPMMGMLLGNACSGVAVGLSTSLDELSSGRDKVEFMLAMGATRMEATREVVQRASRMALTPLLNTMNVVGIVSIPGMMTGQILGGSDPAKAARYQIIIMFLIGAATGLSAVSVIFLAVVSLLDDRHRLRSERLVPRDSAAKGAVAWLAVQAKEGWRGLRSRAGQLGKRIRLAFGRGPGRKRRGGGGNGGGGTAADAGRPGSAASAGYSAVGDASGGEGGGGEGGGGIVGGGEDGGESGEESQWVDIPGTASRLREVLVEGSGESAASLAGASGSPPLSRPLLDAEHAAGSSP